MTDSSNMDRRGKRESWLNSNINEQQHKQLVVGLTTPHNNSNALAVSIRSS